MKKSHCTNVLVTSCLKTPVDPRTKVPLAQYERDNTDNRLYEEELATDDPPAKDSNALLIKDYPVTGDHIDLREFYFSNQEYYRKIEQLKKAHLQTMAELELMYRKKLDLKGVRRSPVITSNLKKARSALELRWTSDLSDLSDEECNTEKGLLISPKELIKSMWQEFSVNKIRGQRLKKRKQNVGEGWHPRVTVPKPFHMTLREAERRKKGIKSRLEIEQENADLRRQVEELTECQRKFHASPVPAHVRLLLYEELQEHRRLHREMEQQRLHTLQRPFSFLERERLKKEQKEAKLREQMLKHNREEEEWRKCPFKAKPVPRVVKEAASGEQQKDEELYRAIKMQMRARELLHSASMPPSMLARHLSEKQVQKAAQDDEHTHRPKINAELPDFNASYRTFRKQLAKHREVRPVAACEPFQLRTANISSHKERIMADIEAEIKSPKPSRWPFMTPPALSPRTPLSSLCSSLSGSQECLKQDLQRQREYQEEMREIQERVKGRPLLLEQVAQVSFYLF
uniref:Protein FAM161A n=1 Tax=Sinocyclocheilus anshuiensis TaxID=1608454 RepID=A0A671QBW3_9TELE